MEMVKSAIKSGAALDKFCKMVEAQGGDPGVIRDTSLFGTAQVVHEVKSPFSGYISAMDTEAIGVSSVMLGAGRETKDSPIDYLAGIMLGRKTGEYVNEGDTLAVLHTSDEALIKSAQEHFLSAIKYSESKPDQRPLIYAKVERNKVTIY
jgi:pyrimidine-nucleoside phosphorylase